MCFRDIHKMFEIGNFSAGTLLGIILGTFLGHTLALRRTKYQAKHNAAVKFKMALNPALMELEKGKSAFEVMKESYEKHIDAALEYSAYLNGRELDKFKYDLERYEHWEDVVYGRSTAEIMYDTNDPEYLEMKSKDPVMFLNALIKHANT